MSLRGPSALLRGEQGVALPLSLLVLVTMTGLALAFLSMSALEPGISRNLGDVTRARYLAEAGVEVGYNTLVATAGGSGWSTLLATASPESPWVALPALERAPLPGLGEAEGTYSVSVRNDSRQEDPASTGEAAIDPDPTVDSNGVVIVRAMGSFRTARRTVEAVVKLTAASSGPRCVMSNWREL